MNTHNIPDRLHDMRVYGDSSKVMYGLATVNLPDLEYLTETMKGAGIAGEFESIAPGLLKGLELGLEFNTVTVDVFDLAKPTSHYIDCRMALNILDGGDGTPKSEGWRVVAKGVPKSVKLGKAEATAQMGSSVALSCTYVKITKGSKTIAEVDILNYVCNFGGTDYLATIRNILGL